MDQIEREGKRLESSEDDKVLILKPAMLRHELYKKLEQKLIEKS